uniref:Uncharacterized protein n=1 Tax=Candidatus Kentrum sp. TC TaxID=2126339 RepID=A0A450YUU2_9GAMM|nr:MAG: hypothetical protein BECKTC1821E_GA0114239_10466 [Candidatus Kentron sp. TC]
MEDITKVIPRPMLHFVAKLDGFIKYHIALISQLLFPHREIKAQKR